MRQSNLSASSFEISSQLVTSSLDIVKRVTQKFKILVFLMKISLMNNICYWVMRTALERNLIGEYSMTNFALGNKTLRKRKGFFFKLVSVNIWFWPIFLANEPHGLSSMSSFWIFLNTGLVCLTRTLWIGEGGKLSIPERPGVRNPVPPISFRPCVKSTSLSEKYGIQDRNRVNNKALYAKTWGQQLFLN